MLGAGAAGGAAAIETPPCTVRRWVYYRLNPLVTFPILSPASGSSPAAMSLAFPLPFVFAYSVCCVKIRWGEFSCLSVWPIILE